MKPFNPFSKLTQFLTISILLMTVVVSRTATIVQLSGGSYIAFEAETLASITNGPPTTWVVTNDATASGSLAIYEDGVNGTTTSSSFALYSIKFSQAGTYSIYYRWRADKGHTDADPNSANSFRVPIDFGDLANDPTSTNFAVASVNNAVPVPAANSYNVFKDNQTYTVSQAQVDAGTPLILKIGTREAGMFIDRFVLSTNNALNLPGDFNALANSDTLEIIQGSKDGFIAFQAERAALFTNSPPTLWVVTNDATANGSLAIYEDGANGTASSSSFASYLLQFSQPGTYSIYYRWRADKGHTDADPNSANSFRVPIDFGDLANDPTSTNFAVASVNNAVPVPAANSYNVFKDNQTYTVSPAQVAAGTPLILKIGTREAGMFIDRFVLSTNSAMTLPADFDALPDSGSSARPQVLSAVGSAGLTNVTISFDKPLVSSSTNIANFSLSGGLGVLGAILDTNTSKDIILTTTLQAQGSNYIITVNGVTDVNGNQVLTNSTVHFTSWKLSAGWVTRELYFNVDTNAAGGGVADLLADPKYPNSPNVSEVAQGLQINNEITGNNYGARIRTFFIPPTSGVYEFFIYNDDAAQLYLSSDQTEASLALIIDSPFIQAAFDISVMGSSGSLVAGQKYLLQALYRQNTGAALLGVAARHQGDTTPPASLPVLGGSLISTFVNPDAGTITFTQQPSDTTGNVGSRARFTVKATSSGSLLYYQWQVNGVDIPNGNRATYVTPVLSASDSGKTYRVVVSTAGNGVLSSPARLTVIAGSPSPVQPYIGINFVGTAAGNSGGGYGGALFSNDVAGVVQQENFNNIAVTTAAAVPLVDSAGAATPVTISYDTLSLVTTGTGDQDADHALFQGYLHNNNAAMTVTLNNIPPATNYSLLLYSVGFNFNATYEQQVDLTGAAVYTTYHVRAQDANQYRASPAYVRMSSTDPNARQLGNYVQYDNISPAADGSLVILLTPESTFTGSNYLPPLNAIQLVKVVPLPPTIATSYNPATTTLTIAWPAAAAGFVLESSPSLGPTATWTIVAGTPNPITGAGSTAVNTSSAPQKFYRLRK